MKKVQLNDLPLQVLAGQEALEVEHEGKLLGYFYPVRQRDTAADDELWDRWEKILDRVKEETGLDEEGLVAALAPKKEKQHEFSA